jgi:hypothetical protein
MSPHILALDIAGAPHRWINVRVAAHYYATDMIAWAAGTNEFLLRGGTQRTTGLQSLIRASSIVAIKGKDFMVRHFDHVPTLTKEMLLARDRPRGFHPQQPQDPRGSDGVPAARRAEPKSSRVHASNSPDYRR